MSRLSATSKQLCRRIAPLVAALVATTTFAQDRVHVVQPGETLWGIAGQYLQSPLHWPDVQQRNGVDDPRRLQLGTALRLGPTAVRDTAAALPASHAKADADADANAKAAARSGAGASEPPIAPTRAAWTGDPLAVAGVSELSGTARMKRGDAPTRALDEGTPLHAGDLLETGDRTYLSFRLRDGSTLVMPSGSTVRVVVADGRTTQLQLLEGRIEALVAKQHGRKFEIRARTVTLGVRGTHFRVREERDTVTAEVLSGVVAVAVDGRPELLLDAARGAALTTGTAPESQPLLPAPQLLDSTSAIRVLTAEPVPDAHGYRLLLATDPAFIHVAYEARAEDGVFGLPDTLPGGFYHARVSAFDARDIEGMPGDRVVHLRGDGNTNGVKRTRDGRYEIRWSAPPGERCLFELARAPDFAQPIVSDPAVYGGGSVVGPFAAPGRYYWRVRSVIDDARPLAAGSFDVDTASPARD